MMTSLKIGTFEKLRFKVIGIALVVNALVLATIFLFVKITAERLNLEESFTYIDSIIANGGKPPFPIVKMPPLLDFSEKVPHWNEDFPGPQFSKRMPVRQRPSKSPLITGLVFKNSFSVKVDSSGKLEKVMKDVHGDISKETIKSLADIIFEKVSHGETKGIYQQFLWKSSVQDRGGRYLFVFLDNSPFFEYQRKLFKFEVIFFIASQLFAMILTWKLSAWAIMTIKKEFEKQKLFLSDAGHELKTPISVISANVDVLMTSLPENKWLQYIRSETERMADLVKKLLYLAKNDSMENKPSMDFFDLCAAVTEVTLPFESVVYEQGKTLEMDLPEQAFVYGDKSSIKQVAVIFLDNALKNSEKDGRIKVSISMQKSRMQLKVFNTGHGIKAGDLDKIFNRFYRSDTSRNRNTGGMGLGLAIAHSIAGIHHGRVYACSEYGKWAEFTFELPVKSPANIRFASRTFENS